MSGPLAPDEAASGVLPLGLGRGSFVGRYEDGFGRYCRPPVRMGEEDEALRAARQARTLGVVALLSTAQSRKEAGASALAQDARRLTRVRSLRSGEHRPAGRGEAGPGRAGAGRAGPAVATLA